MILHRSGDTLNINGEVFHLSDLLNVLPQYDKRAYLVHHYDGKKHYVSNGVNQIGCEMPYHFAETIEKHLADLRICRSQRGIDDKYFQNLRKGTRQ